MTVLSSFRSLTLQMLIGCSVLGLGILAPTEAQTQSTQGSGSLNGLTPPQQVADCGTDEQCLLTQAGVCRPAQAEITRSLEMMGIVTNQATLMQIWGSQGQGCVLHTQSFSAQEGFSSIMTEELQSAGLGGDMMEIMQRNRVLTTCRFNSTVSLSQFLQIVMEQQQGTVDMLSSNPSTSTTLLLVNGAQVATCRVQRAS